MTIDVSRTKRAVIVLLVCACAAGSVRARSEAALTVGVEGRANANPSIAASGSFVGIAWAARAKEGVTDIYAAMSRDGGRSFGTPVRVNQAAGEVSVSGEQPPRIALVGRRSGAPSVVVVWTAKSPSGTRLVSARSTDGGRRFGPAEAVAGSNAAGNRGWESAAVGSDDTVVAVWLDHREMASQSTGGGSTQHAHQHEAASSQGKTDGAVRAQLSQIFFARLGDPGSVRTIARGVCYCCKTSIATGGHDSVIATWRHVYPGNVRDIALAKSSDGGKTFSAPVRVSEDNWVLDGCPENGPAVAVDAANAIHVIWPTLVRRSSGAEPAMQLFYATSKDGQRFTRRQALPTQEVPRHPQIAVTPSGMVVAAWDEQAKGVARIAVARGTSDNKGGVRFARESTMELGSYPAIALLPDAVVVAWGSADVINVARR
jgi:hypothetical protein